jgi:hypothetical protein
MGVLGCAVAAALVALAGCYAPSLRDCTVSCSSQHDCADSQVCGSDGLCASPGVAGHCASTAPDAGPNHDAGMRRDAAPSDAAVPDAPATISLHVQVIGKGSITVDGYGVCSSLDVQHGDCTYAIAPQVAQSVHALSIQPDQVFASWTSMTCSGQSVSCTFTPSAATTIAAKFVHAGAAR